VLVPGLCGLNQGAVAGMQRAHCGDKANRVGKRFSISLQILGCADDFHA